VKINGTCRRDGREFSAEQVIAAGGECPWDGEPFNADYAVTLVNALRDAARAGSELELALTTLADLVPQFQLSQESVLEPLRTQLQRLGSVPVRRG
jgi:hypothetical protein